MSDIDEKLQSALSRVQKPARYIGGEPGSAIEIRKKAVSAEMVLVFPDVYEIGMSHYGYRVLYDKVNRCSDLYSDRCFAPMHDFAQELRANGIPLYGLETRKPLYSFTAVGISVQTELNFTNIPYVLELGGISALRTNRDQGTPFIIGGGACLANPEPVSDFFDLFVIGEGEALLPHILRLMGAGRASGDSKGEILEQLAVLPGIYVPELLKTKKNKFGITVPEVIQSSGSYEKSLGVKRVWMTSLEKEGHPFLFPQPNMELVHNRLTVELMRGCTHGCRFCQAGFWYRPVREQDADTVVDLAARGIRETGERNIGLLSLSTADYSRFGELMKSVYSDARFKDVKLSIPSLRVDAVGSQFALDIASSGMGSSATIAPETGSERIRKMINKNISNEDILNAVRHIFKNGFRNLKVYFMVGLPTESLEDMEETCRLMERMGAEAGKIGRANTLHFNLGVFIPKPGTPMQWCTFMEKEKVQDHINYIRSRFRRNRKIRVTWVDWGLASVENFYARGSRDISEIIYQASCRGQIFETFNEHFSFEKWRENWETHGKAGLQDLEGDIKSALPWDFIHSGVRREYLESEYRKMFDPDSRPTGDCRLGGCTGCGIPGSGRDIILSAPPADKPAEPLPGPFPEAVQGEETVYYYFIRFRKEGLARFIPHHAMLTFFENALKQLNIRMKYSKGFNRRPRIKNQGMLPLGMESLCEVLLVETLHPLDNPAVWKTELSARLPSGMEIDSLDRVSDGRLADIKWVEYRLFLDQIKEKTERNFEEKLKGGYQDKKGRLVEMQKIITDIREAPGSLMIRVLPNSNNGTVSPFLLFSILTGLDEQLVRTCRIVKESQEEAG